jgi:hypothetical protein
VKVPVESLVSVVFRKSGTSLQRLEVIALVCTDSCTDTVANRLIPCIRLVALFGVKLV